jgi:hypothetical protein
MGNNRIVCLDGPREGREYFFPDSSRQFQVTAIRPGIPETAFQPYYGGLIYDIVPLGFGYWGGAFARFAERPS